MFNDFDYNIDFSEMSLEQELEIKEEIYNNDLMDYNQEKIVKGNYGRT